MIDPQRVTAEWLIENPEWKERYYARVWPTGKSLWQDAYSYERYSVVLVNPVQSKRKHWHVGRHQQIALIEREDNP